MKHAGHHGLQFSSCQLCYYRFGMIPQQFVRLPSSLAELLALGSASASAYLPCFCTSIVCLFSKLVSIINPRQEKKVQLTGLIWSTCFLWVSATVKIFEHNIVQYWVRSCIYVLQDWITESFQFLLHHIWYDCTFAHRSL